MNSMKPLRSVTLRTVFLGTSLLMTFCLSPLAGKEIWVVRFNTQFPDVIPPCQSLVSWHSNVMFHNTTDEQRQVQFLAVSNGPQRPDVQVLLVPPHQTVMLRGLAPGGPHWEPDLPLNLSLIWVNKLNVPDGVVVADRGESGIFELRTPSQAGPCDGVTYSSQGLAFRVFDQLTPAGVSQYHLGTSISDLTSGARLSDSRINVGVFNASASPATAVIQVICSIDADIQRVPDPSVVSVQITVPPNSLVQKAVVSSTLAQPCQLPSSPAPYHVIVTSDQPGFSYAAAVSNETLPKFPAYAPVTY